ncbi:unnamed protein product [Pieris macdunnoughi]|uniref:CHK kinase-like domain-containing protein n=1 Tax=Pieris macdunnoughi TaxID=345717 RepID=A0A821TQK7_9NEOP|nr:unnamed protein product [Pieris macdunnoughi]
MSDAEETLRNILDKELDERGLKPRDVTVKAISSGGANYTSSLFLVDVKSPKEDLNLFAKVANSTGAIRDLAAGWLYKTEQLVYTRIAKLFEDLQVQTPEEEKLKFPKFYWCSDVSGKESVVMENLLASGYKTFDRFKSLDWQHGSASVEYLAKFHAFSFALAKNSPEEFEKLTHMKYEIGNQEFDEETMAALWKKVMNNMLEVIKDEQKEKVLKYFESMPTMNTYSKPIGKPVLCHGDFRSSNIMFKTTTLTHIKQLLRQI